MPYVEVLPNETLPELIARTAPAFSVADVQDHPKNSHLFRTRTTYLLKTGDVIWIPDEAPERRWFSVKAGSKATFVVNQKRRPFRVLIRYPEGGAVKNTAFVLSVGELTLEGTTDGDGMMSLQLPIDATQAEVAIDGFRKKIEIGALEPIHVTKGYQGRLRNLGYATGPIDGVVGPKTRAAIRRFQRVEELEQTGKMDEQTLQVLGERYGC